MEKQPPPPRSRFALPLAIAVLVGLAFIWWIALQPEPQADTQAGKPAPLQVAAEPNQDPPAVVRKAPVAAAANAAPSGNAAGAANPAPVRTAPPQSDAGTVGHNASLDLDPNRDPSGEAAEMMREWARAIPEERRRILIDRDTVRQRRDQIRACEAPRPTHAQLMPAAVKLHEISEESAYFKPAMTLYQAAAMDYTPITGGYEVGGIEFGSAMVTFTHDGFVYAAQIADDDFQRCLTAAYANLRLEVEATHSGPPIHTRRMFMRMWDDPEAKQPD